MAKTTQPWAKPPVEPVVTPAPEVPPAPQAEIPAASPETPLVPPVEPVVTPAPAVEPVAAVVPVEEAVREVEGEVLDMVTVTSPRKFILRLDNHRVVDVEEGVQQMEREHALHWYAVANGVKIYDPKA